MMSVKSVRYGVRYHAQNFEGFEVGDLIECFVFEKFGG